MVKPVHRARPLCMWCHRRPALACFRGEWRVIKHHDVCRQCWRSFMDARAAARLAAEERLRARAKKDRKSTPALSRSTPVLGRGH
jgi:hypothetical protein